MIADCSFCEFILFTQKQLFVQRTFPDENCMQAMLKQFFNIFQKPCKDIFGKTKVDYSSKTVKLFFIVYLHFSSVSVPTSPVVEVCKPGCKGT